MVLGAGWKLLDPVILEGDGSNVPDVTVRSNELDVHKTTHADLESNDA